MRNQAENQGENQGEDGGESLRLAENLPVAPNTPIVLPSGDNESGTQPVDGTGSGTGSGTTAAGNTPPLPPRPPRPHSSSNRQPVDGTGSGSGTSSRACRSRGTSRATGGATSRSSRSSPSTTSSSTPTRRERCRTRLVRTTSSCRAAVGAAK